MIFIKKIVYSLIFFSLVTSQIIFDFNEQTTIQDWKIVNDGVMGGLSSSSFELNKDGHAVFKGQVSLANYGGFASVRHQFKKITLNQYKKIIIKLKGDGKKYQFRIKANTKSYYSYNTIFKTSGKWEEITLDLKNMYPSFRGRKLNLPNFSEKAIEEITFLIGNKKAEKFALILDEIRLE